MVQKYDYFIFDCDGVLFHSNDEIGDAFASLRYIKKVDPKKQIFFFTNATTRTREELLHDKLIGDHSFDILPVENLYTASYLTALYLRDDYLPKCKAEDPERFKHKEPAVFVIGEQGFKNELKNFGVRVVNEEEENYLSEETNVPFSRFSKLQEEVDPTVVSVIVGTDFKLSQKKMCMASLYINLNNAELIGTNIDRNDGKDRLRPSGGSLVKLIEVLSGVDKKPKIMGKPDTFAFDLLRQQHNLLDVPKEKFVMVGDNLSTDILFGNDCEIETLLVLSGVTNADKTERILAEYVANIKNPYAWQPYQYKYSGIEPEGVPTHVQSLFAQSETIDFKKL